MNPILDALLNNDKYKYTKFSKFLSYLQSKMMSDDEIESYISLMFVECRLDNLEFEKAYKDLLVNGRLFP